MSIITPKKRLAYGKVSKERRGACHRPNPLLLFASVGSVCYQRTFFWLGHEIPITFFVTAGRERQGQEHRVRVVRWKRERDAIMRNEREQQGRKKKRMIQR